MQKSTFFLALVISFFLIGCGSSRPKPISYPSWYLNPPVNDSSYLYGSGDGISKKEAIDSALNSLASKLSVSVESSFESRKTIYKGDMGQSYGQDVTNTIKSNVKKINFNNYQIEQLSEINGKFLTLVKVDKKKFFNGKLQEFTSIKRVLNDEFNSLQEKDPINRLKSFNEFNTKTNNATSLAYLLNTLDSTYKIDSELQTLETYSKIESNTKSAIKLYIVSDSSAKLLEEPLKVALNKDAIDVIKTKIANKNLVVANISARNQEAKAMGKFIVKKSVNVDLQNYKGDIVSSNKFTLVGKSSFDYKQAEESASRNLNTLIEKEGVLKVLGIED